MCVPGGQTFETYISGDKKFVCPRGTNICYAGGGDKHFYTQGEGTNIFTHRWGGQIFSIGNVAGKDDVGGEEEDVSKANSFVREASKLSAGARILRGPKGPEILVI